MKKLYLIYAILFLLSSCCALLDHTHYSAYFDANTSDAKLQVNDSVYKLPSYVELERSNKDLEVQLNSEEVSRSYTLRPSVSPTFLYSNIFLHYTAPLGYLIDLRTPKRFYYGKAILLDINYPDSVIYTPLVQGYRDLLYKTYPSLKGQLNFTASLPWVNHFVLKPDNDQTQSNTGFMGISGGLEYFNLDKRFVSIRVSRNTDYFFLFPVPAYPPVTDKRYATIIGLANNHYLGKITYGYGVSFFNNSWKYNCFFCDPDDGVVHKEFISRSVGLNFNVYWQLTQHAFGGLNYQPSLWRISPQPKFEYEHLLSLDFMWKFTLHKGME